MKLSFCITCMNRFWQIKDTLLQNLNDNKIDKDYIDFILVDFNSQDGLKDFVLTNFQQELKVGYLKYYFTRELKYWDSQIAKNTSHRLSSNDIIVNLDADNFTGYRGGKFLLDKYKLNNRNIFIHQGQGIFGKGNSGRISCYKEDFMKLGGYNQDFYGTGAEDEDLINRLVAYGVKRLNEPNENYNKAIKNSKADGIKYCESKYTWIQMCRHNKILSINNIKNNNLIANKGISIGTTTELLM